MEEGEMKGLSGAVVSLPLGAWPSLSLLVAGSWSSCKDGAWGGPGTPSSSERHLEMGSGNLWGEHRGRRSGELISWVGMTV